MYDFEARAADYLRQVIEHEEHAANATDANLRVGFLLALAQMCRDLAAQMAAAARAFETPRGKLKGAAFSSFFAALRPEHPRDRGLAERLERRQVSRGWHLKLIAFDTLFDFTPLRQGFFADLSRPWRPGALQAAAPSRQRVWQTKCVRSATLWRECVLDVRIVCH